ncbi:hypothetical protein THAOC_03390 [Thalassiosira oceanica]|uniref:Replication factor-A protein 1 N-terminal domain-containing protein n=1 Tax=Thalassiosira oceanica TaxID=159749 RepID=K0TBM3_THAOC|nr:hypothetical protein THAOC_03390 [Thalassiosira oceanica]|eukprot:EJK74905.1 hypothetical protein THAOC_03390 [Thalassiosira oceanica]
MSGSSATTSLGFNPVLQVLRLELKPELQNNEGDSGVETWSLDLSDGTNFFRGRLVPKLAHLVNSSSIKECSVIRIQKFVTESSANGGHHCVISEVEVVGPNPGAVIGKPFKPFWLTDDVIERIANMDYGATLYAMDYPNMSSLEQESLVSGGLLDVLLRIVDQGFKADCQTIKKKDDIVTMSTWFEILVMIAYMKGRFAYIKPVLELFIAPVMRSVPENEYYGTRVNSFTMRSVPEKEYYGTRVNYFNSVAKLFRVVSKCVGADFFPRSSDIDAFFEFACGAVFWRLTHPEVHQHAPSYVSEVHSSINDVCTAASSLIREELCRRMQTCTRLRFCEELLSIANIPVCPVIRLMSYPTAQSSTFSSGLFALIKESPNAIVRGNLLEVLRIFVEFDCVDRDMIRGIVNLAESYRWAESEQKKLTQDCLNIMKAALNPLGDHHGSWDRRMSIAVDAGLVELILNMEMTSKEEGDATEAIFYELERGLAGGRKACRSIARVDVKTPMLLSGVDVNGPCSFRAKDLVESARGLCSRTCTCCAASLSVGRIFRCDECGTVYCSRICQVLRDSLIVIFISSYVLNCYLQTKDWTMGGHKKTCSGYGAGRGGSEGVLMT